MNTVTFISNASGKPAPYCGCCDSSWRFVLDSGTALCAYVVANALRAGRILVTNPDTLAEQAEESPRLRHVAEALDGDSMRGLAEAIQALLSRQGRPWMNEVRVR